MPEPARRGAVLVAEDDAEVRGMIADYLRAQGVEVVEAADGVEALARLKQVRPASVVLDLLMPRLGGLDALRRIQIFDPAITVVVVTAVEDAEVERLALSLGAAQFFRKPVALPDLAAALGLTGSRPAASARARKPSAGIAPAPVAQPGSAGHILIVDDEPEICQMLQELFARRGYQARSVTDGAAAVRAVLDDPPDVVLLDIAMPRLGGIEALTAIRAIAPAVKVIMVSGQADLEVAKRSLAYGAFDYVAKPLDLAYLNSSVEAALLAKWADAK